MENINYSFKKGYNQVPVGKVKEVKAELMQELGIKSDPSWLTRLRGNYDPKVSDIRAIERVFSKHGITDVWGE